MHLRLQNQPITGLRPVGFCPSASARAFARSFVSVNTAVSPRRRLLWRRSNRPACGTVYEGFMQISRTARQLRSWRVSETVTAATGGVERKPPHGAASRFGLRPVSRLYVSNSVFHAGAASCRFFSSHVSLARRPANPPPEVGRRGRLLIHRV